MQSSLRRTFNVWINRVLLRTQSPGANYPELNDINEGHTMLAEHAKLFMLLLELHWGYVNQPNKNYL